MPTKVDVGDWYSSDYLEPLAWHKCYMQVDISRVDSSGKIYLFVAAAVSPVNVWASQHAMTEFWQAQAL